MEPKTMPLFIEKRLACNGFFLYVARQAQNTPWLFLLSASSHAEGRLARIKTIPTYPNFTKENALRIAEFLRGLWRETGKQLGYLDFDLTAENAARFIELACDFFEAKKWLAEAPEKLKRKKSKYIISPEERQRRSEHMKKIRAKA